MLSLQNASWAEIEAFRVTVANDATKASSLCAASQGFVASFRAAFPSLVLCRAFAVVPFKTLPEADTEAASRFAASVDASSLLSPTTPVLSLLGASGVSPQWNDRTLSKGHLAIPLLSRALVEGIPMIARLLPEVGVDLAWLDDAGKIDSRRMLGSANQCFQ